MNVRFDAPRRVSWRPSRPCFARRCRRERLVGLRRARSARARRPTAPPRPRPRRRSAGPTPGTSRPCARNIPANLVPSPSLSSPAALSRASASSATSSLSGSTQRTCALSGTRHQYAAGAAASRTVGKTDALAALQRRLTFCVALLIRVEPEVEAVVHRDVERAVDEHVGQARTLAGQRRHVDRRARLASERAQQRRRRGRGSRRRSARARCRPTKIRPSGLVSAGQAIGSTVASVTSRSPYFAAYSGVAGAAARWRPAPARAARPSPSRRPARRTGGPRRCRGPSGLRLLAKAALLTHGLVSLVQPRRTGRDRPGRHPTDRRAPRRW